MHLGFCISTIASRAEACGELRQQLGNARVFVDEPLSGTSWTNYRKALLADHSGLDWLICLDDDVELCDDFVEATKRALDFCPGEIANLLYTYRTIESLKAVHAGAHWIKSEHFLQGAGFAIRPHLGPQIVAWAEEHIPETFKSGDQRIAGWVAATGRFTYSAVPSLLEHRTDLSSVMYEGSPDGNRRACWFQKDQTGIEWTSRWVPATDDRRERFLKQLRKRGARV